MSTKPLAHMPVTIRLRLANESMHMTINALSSLAGCLPRDATWRLSIRVDASVWHVYPRTLTVSCISAPTMPIPALSKSYKQRLHVDRGNEDAAVTQVALNHSKFTV